MTCLAAGLCLVWMIEVEIPPPPPVHFVKTETVSLQPQPSYPCGGQ
jgi:hypothetical protein